MEPEFRHFLRGIYAGVLLTQALEIVYREHGVQMRFKDETKGTYRPDEELKEIEEKISAEAQELSKELVDKFESQGVNTPEDFEEKKPELKTIVDEYNKKLIIKLKQL